MKRFLVFSGTRYYPRGGWDDFRGDFDEQAPAIDAARAEKDDWAQVVDTDALGEEGTLGKILWDFDKHANPQEEFHGAVIESERFTEPADAPFFRTPK